MRPRISERLDRAIAHFEAAVEGDSSRFGLAFAELLLARDELAARDGVTFGERPEAGR